jgi:protein ImuB
MLWLALYCPTLPLDCILRRWPEGFEPALAVTDLDGTKRLIAVATRKAEAFGVFAGQSVATALSMLPDLVLVARKLEDERAALMEAALAALRFTPIVSLRASGLVMEISASLKLFGGRRALKKSIGAAMRVQGLHVAAAEAPTPHGAWLLAQEKARRLLQASKQNAKRPQARPDEPRPPPDFATALAALPIVHLESTQASLRRLDGIGCHTFADLRRLPVKGLARRFGPALIDELARAAGDKPDPQIVFEAPSRFDLRIELMARVESAEALVFASQRLLAQMTGWLTARRAAVRGFTLVLHHDRWTRDAIEPTAIDIALATPSNDLTRLGTLVRERLSRIELKAPVLELSLEAPSIVAEQETHGTLFPEREQATETLARLLEKLTARLGHEAMARIERVADHRPERAWRTVSGDLLEERVAVASSSRKQRVVKNTKPSQANASHASGASSPTDASSLPDTARASSTSSNTSHEDACRIGAASVNTAAGNDATMTRLNSACGPRPAWLLAEPQPLEMRVHSPLYESMPLDMLAGPERIETGWWDDAPATRDYFIAENAAGHLVWIYRERLPVVGKPLWYLQGLFA